MLVTTKFIIEELKVLSNGSGLFPIKGVSLDKSRNKKTIKDIFTKSLI
jgi:hypothetical protein